jgi:signal transduction histidine kinase
VLALAGALVLGAAAAAADAASAPPASDAVQLLSAEYLEAYHGRALPAEGEHGRMIRLPSRTATGGELPVGSSWFRLSVQLDPARDRNFSVYVPRVSPNATVYLNGSRLGASAGEDQAGIDAWMYPLLFGVPSALMRDAANVFLVEIRNNGSANHIGLSGVWVGPEPELNRRHQGRLWAQVQGVEVVSLLVGVIGLFALVLWLRRRSEVVFGLFALACGIWIFRNTPFFVVHSLGPYFTFTALTDAALFWLVAVLFRFCCRLLDRPLPILERSLFAVALIVTIVTWAAGERYEPAISAVCYALLVPPSAVFLVYLVVLAATGRTVERSLLCLSAVVSSATGAWDLMVLLGKVPWPGIYLMPYSALFFAGTLGWALTDRFVLAHSRYERLNRELDQRVRAREQELEVHYRHTAELERERAVAGERERMLRDMHDGMGLQLISSMRMVERSELSRAQMSALLTETMDELRIVIDSAKPTGRDLLVMLGNLRYRLEPRLQAAGLVLHWEVGNVSGLERLAAGQVVEITRIVQEAFGNVLKHANASQLHLRIGSERGQWLVLTIEDNGRGFDAATAHLGEGLRNMRNRARRIGGVLSIESRPGGTRVVLEVAAEN